MSRAAIVLAGYRSQLAIARTLGAARRRIAAIERIRTNVACFVWPAELTAAARALAEEARAALYGPPVETITTVVVDRRTGAPTLSTFGA